jgi:SAM-dependent methyltransferase
VLRLSNPLPPSPPRQPDRSEHSRKALEAPRSEAKPSEVHRDVLQLSNIVVHHGARTRRLVIDGTFASLWRLDRVATGSVWDALAAPLLALPAARRRSVLILGLGAGSAARVVRAIAPAARIVGVELDARVVAAARRHFALDAIDVEVVCDDAQRYLARERRRRFDLVIEDVFIGRGRALHKPAWLPEPGLVLAARRLAPGGILVCNAIDEAGATARALARLRPHRVSLRYADCDNCILAASTRRLDARRLRAAIAADPVLGDTLVRVELRTLRERS